MNTYVRWSTIAWPGALNSLREQRLGERHADRVGEALPERPRGRLDAGRDADFGMARRLRMQLAEIAQLAHRQVVAGQVQQRVLQHRAVAVGQHEAVAVGPMRIRGVVAQMAIPQRDRDLRHAHRHAGMPGLRGFDRIHGECADRVGKFGVGGDMRPWDAVMAERVTWSGDGADDTATRVAVGQETCNYRSGQYHCAIIPCFTLAQSRLCAVTAPGFVCDAYEGSRWTVSIFWANGTAVRPIRPNSRRPTALRDLCVSAARDAGLTVVGERFFQFEPQGVTGTVLLAESHIAIHTWPEAGFVTVDVYVCNYTTDNTARPSACSARSRPRCGRSARTSRPSTAAARMPDRPRTTRRPARATSRRAR